MSADENNNPRSRDSFRISNGPIARTGGRTDRPFDIPDFVELTPLPGGPLLFAIARDPRTIFAYWNIDWATIFEKSAPVDRQVHLRVRRDNIQESSVAVEPMAGNHYLKVSQPREKYRVEIGYYQPESVWHSVATSDAVTMPAEGAAENVDVDLATIPFHLSFQRLIDLFRAQNGDALAEIIARLQRCAVSDDERDLLSAEEWEILRAMDLSLDQLDANQRVLRNGAASEQLRKHAEGILGFGATSPSRGFSESSWS
jgi:hypothetical protein